jgi:hypothetical protein
MSWIIVTFLIFFWLFGFSSKAGGSFIHMLPFIALIVLIVQLIQK